MTREEKVKEAARLLVQLFRFEIPFFLIVGNVPDADGPPTTTIGNTSQESQMYIMRSVLKSFEDGDATTGPAIVIDLSKKPD